LNKKQGLSCACKNYLEILTTRFAWRYFRSKKSTNAINIIASISMVAIALVTAALVVVLSVFNGFEDMVKSLYGDFYADIKITPAKGKWLYGADSVINYSEGLEGITKAEAIIEERAILLDQEDKSIVWLKGVSAEYGNISGVPNHLLRGNFQIGTAEKPAVVLGSGIENALQVNAGQSLFPLTVYLPNRNANNYSDPLEALNSANAMATGSFQIQQDFDNQYAYTNKDFLQYMLDLQPGQASSIEIFTAKDANTNSQQKKLQRKLGNNFQVKSRFEQNQSLFAAMQSEKLIIYAVSILILIIAAFNIISSLTMTVLEKQQDIAVLQAMGTTSGNISSIFLKLGAILAGLGGAIGFAVGVLICVGQQQFHWVKLAGNSFLINYYPVSMRLPDFVAIGIIILVIAFFSGWLPSRKAAKTEYSLKS
jgi:lipoprotein-releasing system permease protein